MDPELAVKHAAGLAVADGAAARRVMAPGAVADELRQRLVIVDRGAGCFLLGDEARLFQRLREATHEADRLDHGLEIGARTVAAFLEVTEVDLWRIARVGGAQGYAASAVLGIGLQHR